MSARRWGLAVVIVNDARLTTTPDVDVGMSIRRPRAEVFDAFRDARKLAAFWLGNSTQNLEPSASVSWTMEAGVEVDVDVKQFVEPELIVFTWGAGDHPRTTVRIVFEDWEHGTTVRVSESGATGSGDDLAAWVADSTGGFTMALCAAKALLEHGIELRAVQDRVR